MKKLLNLFKKYWQFLLFVIIIVIIIAYYLGLIPGIKSRQSKLQILETPVAIKSLKEINKLITAEFYGEVVADLREVYENLEFTFNKLKSGDSAVVLNYTDSFNLQIIEYIAGEPVNKNFLLNHDWEALKNNQKWLSVVKRERKQLVYIARGWVKAGFDFTSPDLKIFRPESDTCLVMLIPEPEILYADINPWFSQENQIKGFEIFIGEKEKSVETFEVKAVKHLCKKKLIQDAIDKGLIQKARVSGVKTVQRLMYLFGAEKTCGEHSRTIKIEFEPGQ
ncbi:MAG: DUF4230 domain-containing protein [Bacteroidia bacterium]|nr:DUF4230 domain-containing protein [Bacteroidia bacterium]